MSWYVAHSLDQLLAEINASAPGRNKASDGSIGDANHSNNTSDHNPCDCHDAVCARDFTHDPGGGFDSYAFAHWLAERTKGPEARVKYIISNGQIASGQGQSYPAGVWRPYSGSNPHDHHVHVSVRHGAELFDNAGGWDWSGAATGPEHPPEEEIPEGVPDMYIVINGKGVFALFGSVAFKFKDWTSYTESVTGSTGVPVLPIGDDEDDAARSWLHDKLLQQTARATEAN